MEGSQSFRMDSLLSEMRDLEMAALTKSVPSPEPYTSLNPVELSENVSDWATQYIESGNKFAVIFFSICRNSVFPHSNANNFVGC